MFSLQNTIQRTTPNMNPRIIRGSKMTIGSFSSQHPFFRNGGGSMFQRINIAHTKCLSCPNAR